MRICLVATFPPSGRQLNEYAYYIARELQRTRNVELIVLGDELTDYDFATDETGHPLKIDRQSELPDFNVVRCWKFGGLGNPVRLLRSIQRLKPDVVWFNLVFSSFATPENPVAAFAGLSAPALIRAAGFYTHITLHHVIEHVDFSAAGVRWERLLRIGANLAMRTLLRANSVTVLLPGYYRTLTRKYGARNVLLGTHGTFASEPVAPDFTKRGNPHQRILAIGHWGTYKRLETLMSAFPAVLRSVPNAKLIVAGANHHTKPGYWESVRDAQPKRLPIEFRGYVPEDAVPELYQTTSVVVMPYNSATGSSGPAHQACEYGVPIVCADLPDFREMAADEGMAARFHRVDDANDLADHLTTILRSPQLQCEMARQNFAAGLEMSMTQVVNNYLRWFELDRCKKAVARNKELSSGLNWPQEEAGSNAVNSSWRASGPLFISGRQPVSTREQEMAGGLEIAGFGESFAHGPSEASEPN